VLLLHAHRLSSLLNGRLPIMQDRRRNVADGRMMGAYSRLDDRRRDVARGSA
jgi:hypothetical protein